MATAVAWLTEDVAPHTSGALLVLAKLVLANLWVLNH